MKLAEGGVLLWQQLNPSRDARMQVGTDATGFPWRGESILVDAYYTSREDTIDSMADIGSKHGRNHFIPVENQNHNKRVWMNFMLQHKFMEEPSPGKRSGLK